MKKTLFLIFILIANMACQKKEDSAAPANPNNGSLEAPLPTLPAQVILQASKAYNPSRWSDFAQEFSAPVEFKVPAAASLISGQSGNHWITFTLTNSDLADLLCIYKGVGSVSSTAPSCGANGNSYIFSYCILKTDYVSKNCQSNPFISACTALAQKITTSDTLIKIKRVSLSVNNGDSCTTTGVQLILNSPKYSP